MTIEAEEAAATSRSSWRRWAGGRLPPVIIVAIVVAAYLSGGLSIIDNKLSDLCFPLMPRPATGNVVLVSIDPQSIEALQTWPWPRRFHAKVLDNLLAAGAKRVAFDVDFSASSNPEDDGILEAALSRAGKRAILPVFSQLARRDDGSVVLKKSMPLEKLRKSAQLASVNVRPGPDGLIRHMAYLDNGLPSLAAALAGVRAPDSGEFSIDYGIDPATIPRLSYVDVLRRTFDPAAVAGKEIVIGSTAVELGDQLAVPVYRSIPGPMIHILGYESLVQGRALQELAALPIILFVLLLAFGFDPLLKRTSWRTGAVLAAGSATATLVLAYFLQAFANILVETASGLLTIVLSFVFAVVRHTDQQALRLVFQSIDMRRKDMMMRHVVENSFDGIITLEPTGIIRSVNPAALALFAQNEDAVVGCHVETLFPALSEGSTPEQLAALLRVGEPPHEVQALRGEQESFPAEISANTVELDDNPLFTLFMRDITERKRQRRELEYQAHHDALTGLPNRVRFQEALQQAIETTAQNSGRFTVLLLDLDRFKEVNDTLGHPMGDRLLEQIAARLEKTVADDGIIARFGGDEFAVLLPHADDLRTAEALSRHILAAVKAPFELASLTLEVGGSIGIAMFPYHGNDPSALIKCADVAMYVAKQEQSGFAVYDPEKDVNSVRYLTLAGDLRRAVKNSELVLYYQPKVDLKRDRVVAVEALIRWIHPEHGFIPPDEFIGKAEQTGSIREMTEWVLDTALGQMARWRTAGIDIDVAVNISARLLDSSEIAATVLRLLDKWEVPPSGLILEVTENALMADPVMAKAVIVSLADLGARISIDDFGTGYSSLGYLKDLPADEIKIDKSFVMGMDYDVGNETIVRSTIGMAHALGLKVVAEGIETADIRDLLGSIDCDVGQGYLFSKPMKVEEFDAWLAQCEWWQRPAVAEAIA